MADVNGVQRWCVWPRDTSSDPTYVNRCMPCMDALRELRWVNGAYPVESAETNLVCEGNCRKESDEEWFYGDQGAEIPVTVSREAIIPRQVIFGGVDFAAEGTKSETMVFFRLANGSTIAYKPEPKVKNKKTPRNPRSKKSMRRAMRKAASLIRRLDARLDMNRKYTECACGPVFYSDEKEMTCSLCLGTQLLKWADKHAPNRKVEK